LGHGGDLHRLVQLCLEPVVFGPHSFDPIKAFQPAHREVAARQAVILLDEGKIDRGSTDRVESRCGAVAVGRTYL
jgi:hypothetical protein